MGRVATLVTVLVIAGSLWFGHAPPRSEGAYRRQALATVELLGSQVATARLWVGAVREGRVTQRAASVAFREAEDDAKATAGRFAGYDPPDGHDLREGVTSAADDAVATLVSLRIAANTGAWDRLGELGGDLDDVGRRLADLQRALR